MDLPVHNARMPTHADPGASTVSGSAETDVAKLLSVDQAIAILDGVPVQPRLREVPLLDAQGLRLAEDLRADRDYPPFDKGLMDGYAVRCADATPGAELELVGEVAAGQAPQRHLRPGEAIALMTGAPLPPGADGVVPVEDARRQDRRVRIERAAAPDRHIARRGADCPSGTVVLKRGVRLESAQLAVAASIGAHTVKVFDPPTVTILATGNEIVPMDVTPGPTQIRNCNNIMLSSLVRRIVGNLYTRQEHLPDVPGILRDAIERGLRSDVLLISGGMSLGQYDFVPQLLMEAGVELKITKLRIKPGKPFVFGTRSRSGQRLLDSFGEKVPRGDRDEVNAEMRSSNPCYVFGLPGNPVSGFACTLRLVSRVLRRIVGDEPDSRWLEARLTEPLDANGPREFYQPAVYRDGAATPLKWKGSADVFTLAQANALLVRAENQPAQPVGATVRLLATAE